MGIKKEYGVCMADVEQAKNAIEQAKSSLKDAKDFLKIKKEVDSRLLSRESLLLRLFWTIVKKHTEDVPWTDLQSEEHKERCGKS
jgi:hypothetical protein